MQLKIANRYAFVLLIVYWLSIFTLTHLPLDRFAYFLSMAQPSDKVLHFVIYLVLGFLFWWAIGGNIKVNWSKPKVWCFLIVVVWYGAFDEWLQSYVGRNCNVYDFFADLAGIGGSLLVLSFFTFRPAAVILAGILIFSITNLTQANIMELFPVTDILFYFLSYAAFTFLWIRYAHHRFSENLSFRKLLFLDAAVPAAFLFAVKLFSEILQEDFTREEVLVSGLGIAFIFILYTIVSLYKSKARKGNQ